VVDHVPADWPRALHDVVQHTAACRSHTQHGPQHSHALPGPRPRDPVRVVGDGDRRWLRLATTWRGLHHHGDCLQLAHPAVRASLHRAPDPRPGVVRWRAAGRDLGVVDPGGTPRWIPGLWLEVELAACHAGGIVGVRLGWFTWTRQRVLHLLEHRPACG